MATRADGPIIAEVNSAKLWLTMSGYLRPERNIPLTPHFWPPAVIGESGESVVIECICVFLCVGKPVPANQRRYQGSRRYSTLLAADPATPLASHSIHRSRCPQRFTVLGLRRAAQRFGQRRFASNIQQHLDRYGVSLRDLKGRNSPWGQVRSSNLSH
jgi:hypothetical protein